MFKIIECAQNLVIICWMCSKFGVNLLNVLKPFIVHLIPNYSHSHKVSPQNIFQFHHLNHTTPHHWQWKERKKFKLNEKTFSSRFYYYFHFYFENWVILCDVKKKVLSFLSSLFNFYFCVWHIFWRMRFLFRISECQT